MIIKQSSTDKIVAESKKDFFVDGKRVRDSDLHIEHTVGKITYLVYFDSTGIHTQSRAKKKV